MLRKFLNIFLVAVEVWAVLGFAMPDTTFLHALAFGPPEYAFIFTFVGGVLIYINWVWIYSLTPSGRFRSLAQEIRSLYSSIGPENQELLEGEQLDKAIVLGRKLKKLGINTPRYNEAPRWYLWLPVLAALAETGDIKKAKDAWDQVVEEMEKGDK